MEKMLLDWLSRTVGTYDKFIIMDLFLYLDIAPLLPNNTSHVIPPSRFLVLLKVTYIDFRLKSTHIFVLVLRFIIARLVVLPRCNSDENMIRLVTTSRYQW